MAGTANTPFGNLSNPLDPSSAVNAYAIQRQQALATLLQKQALEPMPDGQMVSGHYIPPSFTQGLAKLGQALSARSAGASVDEAAGTLQKSNMESMIRALQAPSSGPTLPTDATPPELMPAFNASLDKMGGSVDSIMKNPDGQTNISPYPTAAELSAKSSAPTGGIGGQGSGQTGTNTTQGASSSIKPSGTNQLNPVGMNPTLAAYMLMNNPEKYWESQAAAYKPADVTGQIRAMGIDPNSQQGRELAAARMAKENNIPLVAGRAGAPMYDNKGSIVAMAPTIPHNSIPTVVNGRVTDVTPLPGAAPIMQSNAYAEAAGKAQAEPMAGFRNGLPAFGNKLEASMGGGGTPGGVPPNGSKFNANGGGGFTPGLTPGAGAAADVMGQANAKSYQDLKTQAAGASDRINALDNILELANGGTKYGPGTSARVEKLSSLNGFLPSGYALGNDDIANAQVMQKYASNLAGQYMKALGGTGSDAQLQNSIKSIANPDMMNGAIREVIPKLKAMEAAVQAKADGYDNWLAQGNTVDKGHLYERQFRDAYDPRVFQVRQLPEDQQAAFMKNMTEAQYATFSKKWMALKKLGALGQ